MGLAFCQRFTTIADESTIAVGVKTGEVSLVSTSDGARLWTYDMKGTAHWLDYSPDGNYLVVGSGGQGGTTLFDVSTGNPLWTFSFYSASGGFTGDGQYILIHDQPPVVLGLNGHVVEMMPPLLAGRAQFSYITKDKSRIVAAARDMDPSGTGIVFYEGEIVNYTVAAPSAPVLLSPTNGSTVQELSPTLTWRHVNGATSYQLQVATDSTFTNLVFNETSLPDSSKQISMLEAGTKYYWKINAKNDGGTSPFSEVWQFTTSAAGQQPLRPMLVSPANGSTIQELSPTLMWKKEPPATSYQLQVATDSAFTNLMLNAFSLPDTAKQITGLHAGTKYFWHVNATNAGGTSEWSGVWSFTTATTTSVQQIGSDLPDDFRLGQNYPNPFNPTTTIEFDVPKAGYVTLKIFNAFGETVATLVSDNLEAGKYTVKLNANELASGVYLYKLQSGAFVQSKKMLLVR